MKNNNTVIEVEDLCKRFRILQSLQQSNRDPRNLMKVLATPFSRFSEIMGLTRFGNEDDDSIFWALRDVSFQVNRGEVFGIIGKNGAGKSTLLKVLSRITAPSSGKITIRGKVSSLLEVGTGFHPELTGRENVYMNGTLHGLRKREIDAKLDDIIDFSGIGKFVDMPIKRYSSGMGVRLGFAVAAFLDPNILIVDEVLAVGDAEFRKKSGEKMGQVAKEGRTVLFVSHNLALMQSMCSRAILLDKGRLVNDGIPANVIADYLNLGEQNREDGYTDLTVSEGGDKRWDQTVSLTSLEFLNAEGSRTTHGTTGQPFRIRIGFKGDSNLAAEVITFSLFIKNSLGARVAYLTSEYFTHTVESFEKEGYVECVIPKLSLGEGDYHVDVACKFMGFWSDYIHQASKFNIMDGPYYPSQFTPPRKHAGEFMIDHQWKF